MNPIAKIGIGITTVAGASGLGYGIYHNITTSTYSKLLEGTLLDTSEGKNETEWTARFNSLKLAKNDDLVDSLKLVKDKQIPKVAEWKDLRDWCKEIISNSNKGGKEFQNIENYCTFSIKEKLKNAITEKDNRDDSEWAVGHTALKNIDDSKLDKELREAKGKTTGAEANAAVKGWCTSVFTKPFKGEKDQTFENASKVCVTG